MDNQSSKYPVVRWKNLVLGVLGLGPSEMLASAGISDTKQNRIDRLRLLELDLEKETDSLAQVALRKRISELTRAIVNPTDERIIAMRAIEEFTFKLTGPSEIDGNAPHFHDLDCSAPWLVDFWMGCWDADALCGYVPGIAPCSIGSNARMIVLVRHGESNSIRFRSSARNVRP